MRISDWSSDVCSSDLISKWLRANGIVFKREITRDRLTALIGLVAAGVGVSSLPRHCFQSLAGDRRIANVPVKPALPKVPCAAIYQYDRTAHFLPPHAQLARNDRTFPSSPPSPNPSRKGVGGGS